MLCVSFRRLSFGSVAVLAVLTTATSGSFAQDAPAKIDFRKDVAPILQQQCVDCHGPNLQMAELRLDQQRFVLGEDANPDLIKPSKSGDSLLIKRLIDKKLGILMPPSFPFFPGEKAGLAEAQIKTLLAWIDQGANWPDGLTLGTVSETKTENAQTLAFFDAIRAGDRATAAKLLEAEPALINSRNRYGATPLIQAAIYSDEALLGLLIERGADVQAATDAGATALLHAAGDPAKVKRLLERGAKVDVRTALGRTPLLVAATYPGNSESVRLLLKHGANVAEQDPFGETCLTSAAKRGDAELVKLLIEAGADLVAGGRPPLVWAAEEGNALAVACLLEGGANKVPPIVSAALSSAAARGPAESVRLLLSHGADANAPSMVFGSGYTPLMWASYSENQSSETVKLLLDKGAAVQAKARNGATPLSLAKKHGLTQVAQLLEGQASSAASPSRESDLNEKIAATPERIRAAALKSVALLQDCGPKFFNQTGCIACHQQSVTSLAVAAARSRGLKIDEPTARDQRALVALIGKSYRQKFLERVDHPVGSAPSAGYIALGMAADGYPGDDITDSMIIELVGRQHVDGSWTAFSHRPPMEYSRISATALAIRAMQLYGPPGLKDQLARRVERARDWLLTAQPADQSEHAFRLLGLAWAGAPASQIAAQTEALLKAQHASGGWSQLPTLPADAYVTGLALYALGTSSQVAATHDAYQRGVQYLLQTQHADGSWHVATRSFPFQPYFESGFPHGHDQWISATATGFATTALLHALPQVSDRQ